jgi:hypothetical protein
VVHWNDLFPSMQWPQQFMAMSGTYPHACELGAITADAISACDALDGLVDGVISDVDSSLRTYDPFTTVGRAFHCPPKRIEYWRLVRPRLPSSTQPGREFAMPKVRSSGQA